MKSQSDNISRRARWALFAVSLITVPVPYYLFVVGGVVPVIYIIYLLLQGVVVALPKFTAEGFWMIGFLLAHVILLGGILYSVSVLTSWLIFRFLPSRIAILCVFVIITALFVASTFSIYLIPGHNSSPPANLFEIIKELSVKRYGH